MPAPVEPISLVAARRLLAELTPPSTALEPSRLNRDDLIRHGHFVLADVAVRAWKDGGKWQVDAAEIRRAGERLADLAAADAAELVPLPLSGKWADQVRSAYASWLTYQAWPPIVGMVRLADVVQQAPDGSLLLSRPYAEMLTEWGRLHGRLAARARRCEGCRALEPAERPATWREPTPNGYATTCPACLAQQVPPYAGELDGHPYSEVRPAGGSRPGGPSADRYACRICRTRRAAYWDHCHDHGFIRGPLCSGCNQAEHTWLDDAASLRHLWHCPACRDAATVPVRQLLLLGARTARRERHGRCPIAPDLHPWEWVQARGELAGTGAVRFGLRCSAHRTEWDATVTREQMQEATHAHITRRAPDLLG